MLQARAVISASSMAMRRRAPCHSQLIARSISSKPVFPELGPLDRLAARPILSDRKEEEDDDEYLDTGDPDPRYRIGRHLLKMTRVPYRKPIILPDWVNDRRYEITERRTPAQVRRCLKDWMVKSTRDTQKQYFNRPLTWNKTAEPRRTLNVYPYGPEETIAYSNYFFPGRYSVLKRLLDDVKTMLPDFAPNRIIDFGCGPATGAAVAVDVFGREAVHKYAGVDMSQSMQDAAQIMTKKLGVDCHFWTKTSDLIKRALNDDYERFDLAICSYTLTELANDPSRRAAVQILFELLDCGGVVVFVEKGNPEGSFAVRTARQLLLNLNDPKVFVPPRKKKKGETEPIDPENNGIERPQYVLRAPPGMTHMETDVRTLAPCTHDKPCPLAGHYYCSFSQKVFASMIHKDQAEKFSYAIMQKRKRTVFVKEKNTDGTEAVKTLKSYVENKKDRQLSKGKELVFEKKLHSRHSGGVWLNEPGDETPIDPAHDFPTPLTVLQRFQKLGMDADKPVYDDDYDEEEVGPPRKKVEDDDDDMDFDPAAEKDLEESMSLHLDMLEGDMEDADEGSTRRGGRKPRMHPARYQDDDDDDEYDDDDDDTLRFEKPRTQVDVLIDELVDEVDWEEYNPPMYRREWGRILRTPLKNKGHIIMDLCMPTGDIVRSTFSRANIQPVPQLYKTLRKTSWGGLFPVGAGDEDNHSILMKQAKKPHTGMSAARVQARMEREADLLARNPPPSKNSEDESYDPRTAARPKSRDASRRDDSGRAPDRPVVKRKKEEEPIIVPGKDVPYHSTFLRSKSYVDRDQIAMLDEEKELEKVMKKETKKKSISKMGEAFRRRQEAKRAAEEVSDAKSST